MIKFFRKIRQNLLSENKFRKYLTYAIGEIILVVIGILIALQINNWNEGRKMSIAEKELYQRILTDLQFDEIKIEDHILQYKNDQEMHHQIYLETKGFSKQDSIIDFSTIRAAIPFGLIIESNYSNLSKDILNSDINESIKNYFRLENFVHDAFESIQSFKEDRLRPYLSKHGMNDTKVLFDNYQLDYYNLRGKQIFSYPKLKEQYGTVELDQTLFDLGIKTAWALTALQNILEANKELQLELKNELNN
jgi:hypothetical protein